MEEPLEAEEGKIDPQREMERLRRLVEEKDAMLRQQEDALGRLRLMMEELEEKSRQLDEARERLHREITRASLFTEISTQLSMSRNLEKNLEYLLGRLHALMDVEKSSVMLLDSSRQELRIIAARGVPLEKARAFRLPVGEGVAGWVADTGRRLIVPNTHKEPLYARTSPHEQPHFLISLPFYTDGQIAGVLNVEFPLDAPYPTAEQLTLLEEFAQNIGIFVQNVRLYEELQRKVEELSTLYEIGRELSSSLDLDDLLQKIVDSVVRLTGAQVCSLMLLDEDKQTLSIRVAKGLSPQIQKRTRVRVGEGIAGWVAQHGTPLLVEDIEKHPLFRRKNRSRYRTKSLLSVPLAIKGETIGVLNVNNKRNEEVFTQRDLDLMTLLASHAAIAIENARLYEELEQLAVTDGLTQLYVRRHFMEELAKELRRARRYHRPLTVVMMDIDHFKRINDTYGHPVGDEVLRELGRRLRQSARQDDVLGRYGGEEFIAALVETNKERGLQAAERLRRSVEEQPFSTRAGALAVTISLGLASFPEDAEEMEDLIQKADQALYRAKEEGRNRVVAYRPELASPSVPSEPSLPARKKSRPRKAPSPRGS